MFLVRFLFFFFDYSLLIGDCVFLFNDASCIFSDENSAGLTVATIIPYYVVLYDNIPCNTSDVQREI